MSLQEVTDAKSRIRDFILENTPIVNSSVLSRYTGSNFCLKLENLQVTSSFKIRGAANKICQISSEARSKGVVTASAGNHGQAVALCARRSGIGATVVVPQNTPQVKLDRIRQYGPQLIVHGSIYDEAEDFAKSIAQEEGMEYVSPYNDLQVIAGQGTVGLEILTQMRNPDVVLVPVGGGGLAAGLSIAIKGASPEVEVIGVQSAASPSMFESFRQGKQVDAKVEGSVADGLLGNLEANSITVPIVRKYVDRMVVVDEESIVNSIRLLWEEGQVVEGAGAAAVAAVLKDRSLAKPEKNVVAVLSGGNIDGALLQKILRRPPPLKSLATPRRDAAGDSSQSSRAAV